MKKIIAGIILSLGIVSCNPQGHDAPFVREIRAEYPDDHYFKYVYQSMLRFLAEQVDSSGDLSFLNNIDRAVIMNWPEDAVDVARINIDKGIENHDFEMMLATQEDQQTTYEIYAVIDGSLIRELLVIVDSSDELSAYHINGAISMVDFGSYLLQNGVMNIPDAFKFLPDV